MPSCGALRNVWATNRKFTPEVYRTTLPNHPVEVHQRPWTYVACRHHQPPRADAPFYAHKTSIIVSTGGASTRPATTTSSTAVGVYFGHNNTFNASAVLPDKSPNKCFTLQEAELLATHLGLTKTIEVVETRTLRDLEQVVLKCDSSYVVDAMTNKILVWERMGFLKPDRQEIENAGHFRVMIKEVHKLEDMGIEVLFWLIGGEEIEDAKRLARKALEGH